MADIEKVIKWADKCLSSAYSEECNECPYQLNHEGLYSCVEGVLRDAIALLKEQNKTVNTWHHLWDAPNGSFKARCGNCGFVHFFAQGHCSQYRFCPQCGEQKVI